MNTEPNRGVERSPRWAMAWLQVWLLLQVVLWGWMRMGGCVVLSGHTVRNELHQTCFVSVLRNNREVRFMEVAARATVPLNVVVEGPPYRGAVRRSFSGMSVIRPVPESPLPASDPDAHPSTDFQPYAIFKDEDTIDTEDPSLKDHAPIRAGSPRALKDYKIVVNNGTHASKSYLFLANHANWAELHPHWIIVDAGLEFMLTKSYTVHGADDIRLVMFTPYLVTPWTNVERVVDLVAQTFHHITRLNIRGH